MRYVVIGAGAVGGTIGGQLCADGHEVVLVARGEHARVMASDGLTLLTPEGTSTVRPPVVTGPQELVAAEDGLREDDVLVLAVKGQDTSAAVDAWAQVPLVTGGTAAERLPLLCAQNGVANEPAAARVFTRVHGVCVWLPATHLQPGVVAAEGEPYRGVLHLGRWPEGADETDHQVSADLQASGFLAPVREDVMRWKYAKLLGNLANAVEALVGSLQGEDARDLAAQARSEGEQALAAAGIGFATPEEEKTQPRSRLGEIPGHQRGGGSSWQSLQRGTGSIEVDYLNGEIVALGRAHAVATPVNAALVELAGRAAREGFGPGAFSVDQVRAAAGA
ncbi:NAD(P)-binding domain-containing protein [Ruania suaedae]|uniref:ketopantoate reductase family protein n=1 Tax=Ruania suaedae TaxID=2897774 RepID=UPI001E2B85B3|nr:2-dehydropantoate 2-reductase N-terminal domain-containing protein [Ruania suaedae]UFU02522.1 NAD(P)-binding domain-containing protein [Ruania suaedae]